MPDHLLSRREFSAALLFAPALLRARSSSLAARIGIDTRRTIGVIDPKLYGNFAEMLGRCVEGGIFDPGSRLSDPDGYRTDVLQAVRNLHVTLLRWPGGNFASNYHWRDGVGPRDKRPKRFDLAWGSIEDNRFGTHEFLRYCEIIEAQPYLCANLGTGTWDEAQQWVEYCNFAGDTATTALRRRNGRDQPWNVKYWGLGNEMDGPWQMGHRNADDYGKFAREAAKLMKWTDPGIKLVISGSSDYAADWIGWNRTVLHYLKEHADYLSLHLYVGNSKGDYYRFLASSLELANRINIAESIIRAAMSHLPERAMYIAWDEWNVWYRSDGNGKANGRHLLEEHYNLEDALVVATFLNTFINHAHIVKIANLAQLVNVIAPIFTDENGLYLQTIYYPLQLFAANSFGTALDLVVESPGYSTKEQAHVPYLDVSAAYQNGNLVLNVVNRHLTEPIPATFEAADKRFSGTFTTADVNGPDIKAQNDFGSTPVRSRSGQVETSGARLAYTFPPHSYTMLKGRLA